MNEIAPELHDIGKMVDTGAVIKDLQAHPNPLFPLVQEPKPSRHSFEWLDWERVDWQAEPFRRLKDALWLSLARLHHARGYDKLPTVEPPPGDLPLRKHVLLLKIADHYASTFSRAVAQLDEYNAQFKELGEVLHAHGVDRRRTVLWRQAARETAVANRTGSELLDLLKRAADPELSAETFLEEKEPILSRLPEDATAPRDVTSLLTHMRLVGKLYRFLAANYADGLQDDGLRWLDRDRKVRTAGQGTDQAWRMTLATCRLRIPQYPARVGDLNVFRKQEEALKQITDHYRYQVLFYTNDTVWLALPDSSRADFKQALDKIMEPLWQYGLWAETRVLEDTNLRVKRLDVRCLRWHRDKNVEQDGQVRETAVCDEGALLPAFDPPICSICQMRPATRVWPTDSIFLEVSARGGTLEDLCDVCFKIRDIPARERFTKLAGWHPEDVGADGDGERPRDLKTAWVKLTLDYDTLIDYLGNAFDKHLAALPVPADNAPARQALEIAREEFNPLALMADFTEDYRRMTQALYDRLKRGEWQFESIREKDYKDFFVVRVENGAGVLRLLQLYGEVLLEYFPDALAPCPVRLAVNVSLTKYPFYEHWRWISAPQAEVNLQMPGTARVTIGTREFFEFMTRLDLSDPRGELRLTKTYLEKLRSTEVRTGKSRSLLTAVLTADIEARRIPQTLQPFIQMISEHKITIQDMLDWYKITTWGRER